MSKEKRLSSADALRAIVRLKNPERARTLAWFFKTGKGEYGEGDVFAGLTVPQVRGLTTEFCVLAFPELEKLLLSEIHEARMLAVFILVHKYQKADAKNKKLIYQFYLAHSHRVNNWDLVDSSAVQIVGQFLERRSHAPLKKLAKSKLLWDRRIAIVATYYFIKRDHFAPTFEVAELLMEDSHDLIHKAVGWMLREVGKRDAVVLKKFLVHHLQNLPRTTLRYAIERFPEAERKKFLKGTL